MDRQCSSCGGFCKKSGCERENVKPEPEPVAWGLQQQFEAGIGTTPVAFKRHDEFGFVVPLYTAPPQREWVGLTDEDMDELIRKFARYELIRAIEAKLKEKNT